MAANLWNTQSPTQRIDLYFKIDNYKKHLLSLQNVKSTFKNTTQSFFPKTNDLNRSIISSNNSRTPFPQPTHLKFKQQSSHFNHSLNFTSRESPLPSSRIKNKMPHHNSSLDAIRLNASLLFSTLSPKKFTNFREWKINEDNKIILKKLQNTKASPQLSKKKLFHKYSMSDLKYKMNLQKTRYKNVDFTQAAQKLLKGEKIKFYKIRIGITEKENGKEKGKETTKINEIHLNWKISIRKIPISQTENINLAKVPR